MKRYLPGGLPSIVAATLFVFCLSAPAVAQPPPAQALPAVPHAGPFIPGHVILTLRAESKNEAMQIASTLPNFRVDESFGAIELSSDEHIFLVRGDKLGPIVDTKKVIIQEAADALLSPQ